MTDPSSANALLQAALIFDLIFFSPQNLIMFDFIVFLKISLYFNGFLLILFLHFNDKLIPGQVLCLLFLTLMVLSLAGHKIGE